MSNDGGMPSSPASTRPRPRLIDGEARVAWQLPEAWLRGILAGAEGVLGTWLIVVVPAIATYVATAASPHLGSASWLEAGQLGTAIWLAAHGAQFAAGEVTVTILPLGVSLLAVWLTAAAIRRAALESWLAIGLAAGTYLAGTALLARLTALPGSTRALWGAAVVVLLAAGWGMRRAYPLVPAQLGAWATRMRARLAPPPEVSRALTVGAAGAGRACVTILGAGLLATIVAIVFAFPLILAVHDRLEVDAVSAVVLTGAQLLLLPTFVSWAISYLSGGGFSLGQGTLYTPGEVISGPLPAVPALGALPAPESALSSAPVLGYVFLLVGALLGLFVHRRLARGGRAHLGSGAGAVAVATALTIAAVTILGAASSGAFGPGRFAADVGPHLGAVALRLAWQLALPALAVVVAANPAVHAWVGRTWARVRGVRSSRSG